MSHHLPILRKAGFFKEYQNLSDSELLETLYQIRKKEYAEIFELDYKPGRSYDDQGIAIQDKTKVLDIDLEADVQPGNEVYCKLLEAFTDASNGQFIASDMVETWRGDEGPLTVSFMSNGKKIKYDPAYNEDWIDGTFFNIICKEMAKGGNEQFHLCFGPNEEWAGQNVIYIRLTPEEKTILETELNWEFGVFN